VKKNIIYHALAILLAASLSMPALAQKIYTKNGSIHFFSKSPLEDITAKNNEVTSVINQQTGEIQFSVLIKSFRFKKSLMEQHFNENYLESDQFPKALFKGRIENISSVNFGADVTYPVTVGGDLTIHGVTNKVSSKGDIMVKNSVVSAQSSFNITLADYKITIPSVVKNNIAKTIAITVSCLYNQKM
jgi:polyisoprenoid-binding protein YceI